MSCRVISNLHWARQGPNPWPKSRSRGAKRQGLLYQTAVCQTLRLKEGLWWEFEDDQGPGWCSPDGLAMAGGRLVVVEVKLTQTLEAFRQLRDLYAPVLTLAFGQKPLLVAMCKNRTPEPWPGPSVTTMKEALEASGLPLLHLPWPKTGATRARSRG